MATKVCYLGDGSLGGAASYLAGIMLHFGIDFDYVPSGQTPSDEFIQQPHALYVVSDYQAATFGQKAMQAVAAHVEQGAGLVMLGGWESYFGRLGEYHASPLAEVLPVVMQQSDDRRNYAQPCLINKVADHPIVDGLPWHEPPGIGGFNVIAPKPDAQVLLTSVQFNVSHAGHDWQFMAGDEAPLLVVGQYGQGRTAALATDVAPHWVGGFVDWGKPRISRQVADGGVEIGCFYAQFFRNLLVWTGKLR